MDYATLTDLRSRLRRQFDVNYAVDGVASEIDAAADLAGAQAEIDGAVAMRWTPPTSGSAPALLKEWTLTLAAAKSYLRLPTASVPEGLAAEVTAVRATLKQVADGKFSLAAAGLVAASPDGSAAGAISSGNLDVYANPPTFGRENLKGW